MDTHNCVVFKSSRNIGKNWNFHQTAPNPQTTENNTRLGLEVPTLSGRVTGKFLFWEERGDPSCNYLESSAVISSGLGPSAVHCGPVQCFVGPKFKSIFFCDSYSDLNCRESVSWLELRPELKRLDDITVFMLVQLYQTNRIKTEYYSICIVFTTCSFVNQSVSTSKSRLAIHWGSTSDNQRFYRWR